MATTASSLAQEAAGRIGAGVSGDAAPNAAVEEADPFAPGAVRRLAGYALAVAAVAALPVWKMWTLPETSDLGVTTALILAGAGWHLWRFVPPAKTTAAVCTIAAWSGLGLASWQLLGTGPEDYWFVRAAMVFAAVALVALWGGIARGWRVIVAVTIWAAWLHVAPPLERALSGAWICESTASLAGWLLWQAGQDVAVSGALIRTASGMVAVGGPCTGVPLASVLTALLAITALLLRLSVGTFVRLGVATLVLAFLVGVARVAWLAVLVDEAGRFEYWHSPEGASWFTAASLVALAGLISRSPDVRCRPHAGAAVECVPARLRRAIWPVAVGALTAAWFVPAAERDWDPGPPVATAPTWSGAEIARSETRRIALPARPHNRAAWRQDVVYRLSGDAQLRVTLAAVPLWLDGDPRRLPDGPAWSAESSSGWSVAGGGEAGRVWTRADEAGVAWLAALTRDGEAVVGEADWRARYRAGIRDEERWMAWLRHERPLLDKWGYFLALRWEGAQAGGGRAEAELAAAFTAWRSHVRAGVDIPTAIK